MITNFIYLSNMLELDLWSINDHDRVSTIVDYKISISDILSIQISFNIDQNTK